MQEFTCCFIGHRHVNESQELLQRLSLNIEKLILNKQVDTFLFGSKSDFNSLCYEAVTQLRKKYPFIKRVYVRAEYPEIDKNYEAYLLERYEDTYYPKQILRAGRAVYVERNYHMINQSKFCIVYYTEKSFPQKRKSGTKIALKYAIEMKKEIILLG